MKWVNSILKVTKKVRSVIKFVLAVDAAIKAFEEFMEKDEPQKEVKPLGDEKE